MWFPAIHQSNPYYTSLIIVSLVDLRSRMATNSGDKLESLKAIPNCNDAVKPTLAEDRCLTTSVLPNNWYKKSRSDPTSESAKSSASNAGPIFRLLFGLINPILYWVSSLRSRRPIETSNLYNVSSIYFINQIYRNWTSENHDDLAHLVATSEILHSNFQS